MIKQLRFNYDFIIILGMVGIMSIQSNSGHDAIYSLN